MNTLRHTGLQLTLECLWRPSSLGELTPMILDMGLIHLGKISLQNKNKYDIKFRVNFYKKKI